MNSHIEIRRLQKAAEQKILLDSQDWKHIEGCRKCVDELTQAVRLRQTAGRIRQTPNMRHAA
jgi:hypothetical protein